MKKNKYLLLIIIIGIVVLNLFKNNAIIEKDALKYDIQSEKLEYSDLDIVKQDLYKETENENLEVNFIDVGQADSILIIQGDHSMLIDGGNNADSDLVVQYIEDKGISKLDYVIGTHVHEDHIGGLDKVIDTYEVENIFFPKQISNTLTFESFVLSVSNKKKKLYSPNVGEIFDLGDSIFEIIAPNSESYSSANNYSIVIKLIYGNNSFLLTGDAEDVSENEIVSNNIDISADVLKVGHHGSDTSTTQAFLDKVSPKYAIVSVGENNKYDLPNNIIINRLKAADISIYRTDKLGTITAISDGNNISFDFTGNLNEIDLDSSKIDNIILED